MLRALGIVFLAAIAVAACKKSEGATSAPGAPPRASAAAVAPQAAPPPPPKASASAAPAAMPSEESLLAVWAEELESNGVHITRVDKDTHISKVPSAPLSGAITGLKKATPKVWSAKHARVKTSVEVVTVRFEPIGDPYTVEGFVDWSVKQSNRLTVDLGETRYAFHTATQKWVRRDNVPKMAHTINAGKIETSDTNNGINKDGIDPENADRPIGAKKPDDEPKEHPDKDKSEKKSDKDKSAKKGDKGDKSDKSDKPKSEKPKGEKSDKPKSDKKPAAKKPSGGDTHD
jgi:hypothetical protein